MNKHNSGCRCKSPLIVDVEGLLCMVIIGLGGLEDSSKLICGLDSEFGRGSGCGVASFGIFGVSGQSKDCGDAGIHAEGGTESCDVGIPAEGGISGRFKDCGDKSETEQTFKKFHLMVQNLFNSKIQVFCIDNGGEYFHTILGKYL